MSTITTHTAAERIILARLSAHPTQWTRHYDLLPRNAARQCQVVADWIARGIIEEDPDNARRPDYLKQYRLADPTHANADLAQTQRRERVARLYAAKERARENYEAAQAALAGLHDTFTRAAAWDAQDDSATSCRDMTHDLALLAVAIENCNSALVGVYSARQAIESEENRNGPIPDDMRPSAVTDL